MVTESRRSANARLGLESYELEIPYELQRESALELELVRNISALTVGYGDVYMGGTSLGRN